jgi:hypothetical protein
MMTVNYRATRVEVIDAASGFQRMKHERAHAR